RSRRALRPLIKQNELELGLCLTEAQAALAIPGRNGGFNQWLRRQHIVRATAYRLIRRYAERLNSRPQSDLNCLTGTVSHPVPRHAERVGGARPYSPSTPLINLHDSRLTLQLDSRLQQVFRQSLRYLLAPGARPVNLPEMVCGALCSQTPPDVRSRIRQLWDLPLSHFTTSDFTDQPDIRIFLGEPGAIPCY
ncbi:MAG TPA: hypothetical protein VIC32_05225, partial [Terriglobales bacterium]